MPRRFRHDMSIGQNPLAARSPVLFALFRLYLHWYFWRHFSGVRLSGSALPPSYEGRPLVVYTNHPSWWDPALFILVTGKLFPGRHAFGPMDAAELRRYGLFRRMGVFGVEPTRRGAAIFLQVARRSLSHANSVMWVTAEGKFTDPRVRPILLRPGIAHLPRHVPNAIFLPVALEYSFWNESRPEALIRVGSPVDHTGDMSVDGWRAALEQALERNVDALAAESMTRDPGLFTSLLRGTAGVGGIYDMWRRARALLTWRTFRARHEQERA
jgi:1-acyl-sn-glycerol-3-phosphate acyltransferase